MKIAIATVQIPFVRGGAEFLANNLKSALIERGHEAELVTIPFMDSPISLIEDHIVATRLLDLNYSWGGRIDLCIGLKFPAYYIPHDNKVIWALHQHRTAYDLYGTKYSTFDGSLEHNRIRDVIMAADNRYLEEAKRRYTISHNVSKRMLRYNGLQSMPLYHPCPQMEQFYLGEYGEYILVPSRINQTKRQGLVMEALAKTKENVKVYFMGKADVESEKEKLIRMAEQYQLSNRIKFFDYVTEEEKLSLYANARAVVFVPIDEDYGYITLEAMSASKAVITTTDSGGPLEFVVNGKTGIVTEPTAQKLAEAMDQLMSSKEVAVTYGQAGKTRLQKMNITWDYVVKELTK